VVKASPVQGHDYRTIMDGFLNWETSNGVHLEYTEHYTLNDFDLIAARDAKSVLGFDIGANTFDVVTNRMQIEGFRKAVDLEQNFTKETGPGSLEHVFIDLALLNNREDIIGFDSAEHRVLTSSDLSPGTLDFVLDTSLSVDLSSTGWRNNLVINGTKIDSLGTTDRGIPGFDNNNVTVAALREILIEQGYYETVDGKLVMLVPDAITDRVTGEILKFQHVVALEHTEDYVQTNLASFNNGLLDTSNSAPVTANDFATTQQNQMVALNVLENDLDADLDMMFLESVSNPQNGSVRFSENGSLEYTPDHGYSGIDSFDYWAMDALGNRTQGSITVDIWDI